MGVATLKVRDGESLGFAVAADHVKELLAGGGVIAEEGRLYRLRDRDLSLDDLTQSDLDLGLKALVELYRPHFSRLRTVASRCDSLKERLRDKKGNELDFALAELTLEYVEAHDTYARSGRPLPKWHELSCIPANVITPCYEGVAAYNELYSGVREQTPRRGAPSSHQASLSADLTARLRVLEAASGLVSEIVMSKYSARGRSLVVTTHPGTTAPFVAIDD